MKFFSLSQSKFLWHKMGGTDQQAKNSTKSDRAQTFMISLDQFFPTLKTINFFGNISKEPPKSAKKTQPYQTRFIFRVGPAQYIIKVGDEIFYLPLAKILLLGKNQPTQVCLRPSGKVRTKNIIQKIIKIRHC